MERLRAICCIVSLALMLGCAKGVLGQAEDSAPLTTQPGQTRKLAHMVVDAAARQLRVEAESIAVDAPLEFLCVVNGGPEHEAVLRSPVKPSDLHLGLLMLGLKPGEPVRYSEAAQKWFPPHGPPLHLSVEWQRDGQTHRIPAYRLMRHLETKKEMPATTWIFAGSRVMDDGNYAADVTGYLVSVVNFDLTVIDVPDLRSNANETLDWEVNTDICPPRGTPVTLIIEPAGAPTSRAGAAAGQVEGPIDAVLVVVQADGSLEMDRKPATVQELSERLSQLKSQRPLHVRLTPAEDASQGRVAEVVRAAEAAGARVTVVSPSQRGIPPGAEADRERMRALRSRWEEAVRPNRDALRLAAQAHYEVIDELRQEQQRLIDEADRVQRLIDELEREYQDITTPRPTN